MARIKCLLLLTILFISHEGIAQTQKGSLLINGNASFKFDKVKQKSGNVTQEIGKERTIDIKAGVGYFVMDGIAVGGILNWQRESFISVDDEKDVLSQISIGPFGRYYSALGPFFHAELAFGGGKSSLTDPTGDESSINFNATNFGFGIGYPYFISDAITLEPLLIFSTYTKSWNDGASESIKDKKSGLMFSLGLTYYFF